MSTRITFLGHSTVLLQAGTLSFLTDPVFSPRVLGLRRHSPLPIHPEELPELSALLISHAHYDHLDLPSFKYFSSKIPILLPQGLGKLLSRFTKNPLIELATGASHLLGVGLKVTAFPVSHTGFRISGLTFRNCNGYLIELAGKRIFFPGDTGYRNDFGKFKADLAFLPIGPCRPEWFMRRIHLNPDDALRVLDEIGAPLMIPIHWGTFRLSPEPVNEPLEKFKKLVQERNLQDRVRILNPGESLTV